MEPKSFLPSWKSSVDEPVRAPLVGRGMRDQIGYCWQKAEEYAARAAEAPDQDTRELFIRFRNSWLSAANRYEPSRAPVASSRPAWQSSPARPTDGLTSAPAERLGGV